MKLILMGTSAWSVPVFERAASEHEIIAVFTRAPKPAGRKMVLQKSPVHVWAESRGLSVHTSINEFDLLQLPLVAASGDTPPSAGGASIDFIVVASYGVILRDNVLTAAPAINIHPSLLPKYRGPAPMLTAILNGDFETGVCLMDMAPEVDAGDIHMVRRLEIGENNTVADLESRVSVLSADMLSEYLKNPDAYPPMPQVGEPTFTRKFNAADMEIDWNKTPLEIHNQVRSIGGRTKINGIDVKILETRLKPPLVAASGDTPPSKGGRHDTEFQSDSVQCAPPERGGCPRSGLGGASIVPRNLEILRVQPAGKKPMDWKSFVNGLRGAEVKLGV